MVKEVRIVYFDQRILDLQTEISEHPKLVEKLSSNPGADIQDKIALVAIYANLMIDKVFKTDEEIYQLCEWLTGELRKIRSPIIMLDSSSTLQ